MTPQSTEIPFALLRDLRGPSLQWPNLQSEIPACSVSIPQSSSLPR